MSSNVCHSCGYTFKSDDKVCKYCGSSNPRYEDPKNKSLFLRSSVETFQKNQTNELTVKNSSDMNVCLLIFLVIVFWPAAVVYAIVKMKK